MRLKLLQMTRHRYRLHVVYQYSEMEENDRESKVKKAKQSTKRKKEQASNNQQQPFIISLVFTLVYLHTIKSPFMDEV